MDDTREKLEADVHKYYDETDNARLDFLGTVYSWLDRQAAIVVDGWKTEYDCMFNKLNEQVITLTAERDHLQAEFEHVWMDKCDIEAERDRLREALDDWQAGTFYAKLCEARDERDRLQRVVRTQADSFGKLEREISDLKAAAASGGQSAPEPQHVASDGLKTPANADLVAVTRCRDCRRAERYGGELVCKLKSCAWYAVDADGFCSQGEPRE